MSREDDETGWLIEKLGTCTWWNGAGFTRDSNDAIRFARKRDAEMMISLAFGEQWQPGLAATEHMWTSEAVRRVEAENALKGRP